MSFKSRNDSLLSSFVTTRNNVLANSSNITSFRELQPSKWQLTWHFLWKLKAESHNQTIKWFVSSVLDRMRNNRRGRSLFVFPLELSNMKVQGPILKPVWIQIDKLQQYINFVQFWKVFVFLRDFVWLCLFPEWSRCTNPSVLYNN